MADPIERRGAERFAVNANVSCAFASPVLEDFGPVKVKNISLTGVGLVVPQVLDPGIMLAVKLVNPSKKFSKTVLAQVVHVTAQPGGSFLVGGHLDTPLTYEELCIFVM
jgi:hypothetical protein